MKEAVYGKEKVVIAPKPEKVKIERPIKEKKIIDKPVTKLK
jgi:hypothetical protein